MSRLLTAALLLASAGCSEPVDESGSEHSVLLASLEGTWRVEGLLSSDCPARLERAMPLGETTWSIADGHLHIASRSGTVPSVALAPVGPSALALTTDVAVPGCTGTESLRLSLEGLDERWASGRYDATLAHDGSTTCAQLAQDAGLPERCQTTVIWQARRL